jgi:hypothetical protein
VLFYISAPDTIRTINIIILLLILTNATLERRLSLGRGVPPQGGSKVLFLPNDRNVERVEVCELGFLVVSTSLSVLGAKFSGNWVQAYSHSSVSIAYNNYDV